jgi:hypothetical protein
MIVLPRRISMVFSVFGEEVVATGIRPRATIRCQRMHSFPLPHLASVLA